MLFLLLLGITYAGGPSLQVSDYSVVPENIYPGSTGQLQVTLHNGGDETATGATIYYTYYLNDKWNMNIGDVAAGANTITTVPFRVPSNVDSGIIVMNLEVYYRDADNTDTKVSKTSIPITVSQHQVMEVNTISLDHDSIQKGETITSLVEIVNTGGTMKNVIISTASDSAFMLKGTTQKRVGDIGSNSSQDVSIQLVSSSSVETGRHNIPIQITYYDSLQNSVTQTVYIGSVIISDPSTQFSLTIEPLSESEIGSSSQYKLTIENHGSEPRAVTVNIGDSDVFTPIGSSEVYFDNIDINGEATTILTLGVDAGVSSGYYTIPLTVNSNGDSFTYNLGIAVQATPEITLTTETSSSSSSSTTDTTPGVNILGSNGLEATIRIANSGNTQIRSVYVSSDSTDNIMVDGISEKFIGTLNIDDFATYQIDLRLLKPDASGKYVLPLTITFKDGNNEKHTITKNIEIKSENGLFQSLGAGATDSAGAESAGTRFAGNRTIPGGLSPLLIGAGVILMAVLGYFGYRKWRGSKNETKGSV